MDEVSRTEALFRHGTAYSWSRARAALESIGIRDGAGDQEAEAVIESAVVPARPLLGFMRAFVAEYRDREDVQSLLAGAGDADLMDAIAGLDDATHDALLLVRDALSDLSAFVSGEKTGDDIIFTVQGLKRWRRLFRDSLLMKWNGRSIVKMLEHSTGLRPHGEVWLEIGGGVGGTAYDLIDFGLARGALNRYIFTDLAPTFLSMFARESRRRFGPESKRLEVRELNLNDPLPDLRCTAVFGTNVIHCASDPVCALNAIGDRLLGAGGFLYFAETTRSDFYRTILLELFYLFLSDYATFPAHGATQERGLYGDEQWMDAIGRSALTLVAREQPFPWTTVYGLEASPR